MKNLSVLACNHAFRSRTTPLWRYCLCGLTLLIAIFNSSVVAAANWFGRGADKADTLKAVVPKIEPLSGYGNPLEYKVAGKIYRVLRSAKGFRQEGIASWYGKQFHKKRTSSGEPYDMYAMTAAHKTLPIPCYVRVKNEKNKRQIIVRVNDRGPFRKGRIIDLSYAAAKKLGITKNGLARVSLEAIVPEELEAVRDAHYYVQVAAYKAPVYANRLRDKIQEFLAAPALVGKKGKFYVVFVGPLEDKAKVDGTQKKLAQHGFKQSQAVIRQEASSSKLSKSQ